MSDKKGLAKTASSPPDTILTLNKAQQELHTLVSNVLFTRMAWMKKMMDGPNRDLNKDCGYPETLSVNEYREIYDREGFASRVVNVLPDESWSLYPELYEDEDEETTTPFEKRWAEVERRCKTWHFLHRIDRLSGLGQFGALVLGFNDLKPGELLEKPVEGVKDDGTGVATVPKDLMWLRAFPEDSVIIDELEADQSSPRFNQPKFYKIDFGTASSVAGGGLKPLAEKTKVHWTRVIHVADNRESSEFLGTARMQQVYNRLHDLRKLLGSSAEMFWKGGFPGYSVETLPELADGDSDIDTDATKKQLYNYMNRLQRYVMLNGMTMKSLAPQVADPTSHVTQQLIALCAAIGVPLRIFLGSEAGHLASTQDSMTWNRRLGQRQSTYLVPMLINPFAQRLVEAGVLPVPAKPWKVFWRDLNALDDQAKADVGVKRAQALLQYVSSGAETIMPPLDFFVYCLEIPAEQAKQILANAVKNAADPSTEVVWDKPTGPASKQIGGATDTNPAAKTGANGQRNAQTR